MTKREKEKLGQLLFNCYWPSSVVKRLQARDRLEKYIIKLVTPLFKGRLLLNKSTGTLTEITKILHLDNDTTQYAISGMCYTDEEIREKYWIIVDEGE